MIDKERVFKLATKLKNSYFNQYEDAITEWLEQNQPETEVVGLSDEQIKALTVCLFNNANKTMTWTEKTETVIRDFLKTQTFSRSVGVEIIAKSAQQSTETNK